MSSDNPSSNELLCMSDVELASLADVLETECADLWAACEQALRAGGGKLLSTELLRKHTAARAKLSNIKSLRLKFSTAEKSTAVSQEKGSPLTYEEAVEVFRELAASWAASFAVVSKQREVPVVLESRESPQQREEPVVLESREFSQKHFERLNTRGVQNARDRNVSEGQLLSERIQRAHEHGYRVYTLPHPCPRADNLLPLVSIGPGGHQELDEYGRPKAPRKQFWMP